MQFLRNSSIRRKQMFVILLTSSAALLIACAAVGIYDVINFRARLTENLTSMADVIGKNSTAALDFDDPKSAAEALSALRGQPNVIAACIFNDAGQVFAQFQRQDVAKPFIFPRVQADGHDFRKGQLQVYHRIKENNEVIGTIYIVSDLRELSKHLLQFAAIVALVFAGSLLLAFLLSNRLQKLITSPILNLAAVAQAVGERKDYSLRAIKRGNDEIGGLIDGFNNMLTQIQERDANLEHRVAERTDELERENAERRNAEEALRESQALYASLVEQLPAGVFRKDVEGRYVLVNSLFHKMRGEHMENLLGKTAEELSQTGTASPATVQLLTQDADDHREIMRTGKPLEMEEQNSTVDGGTRYMQVIKSPVFGPNGRIIGSQGILMDITERKRAEAELSYERNLLRCLMDSTPDCIYFKDRDSRFIRCSANMARLYRVADVNELMGKRDSDFFAAEQARRALADEQKIIRTGEPIIGKVEREMWSDGRITWALTSKMPLRNETDHITGTFGISKDITPIKDAEEKLEAAHKQLVDASRQAGMAEVATSVLHNVGNVLNSVNVSSSLIAERIRNSGMSNLSKVAALLQAHQNDLGSFFTTNPKGIQVPGYLAGLATHLAQEQADILREIDSLVNNIVHIKEIVSMQQNYAKSSGVSETLNVTDLVEDAIRMNDGALSRHHLKVVREYADTPAVLTQKHKVLQILVNLIRNAKYACDDSGRDDKQIIVRVACEPERIAISIIDNGVGIPAENLTRIFNHGFTTRKDGHGFGLHSGALAAKELGGSLSAFSGGIGQGATFTLELPLNSKNNS